MSIINSRRTVVDCPKCKAGKLTEISIEGLGVSHYDCDKCGAYYDAGIHHDFPRKQHWRIGRLRNPEFWNYSNETIEDGLAELDRKRARRVPEYLGTYPIEKLEEPKNIRSSNEFDNR